MPSVSSGNLTTLRADGHEAEFFLSAHVPRDLWAARINDGSIGRGDTSIAFDGGSGSFWSGVGALQEVWVGTSVGGKEVGRLRIRSITSGDSGTTGTLTVAEHNYTLQDDHYLTFKHDYPLKPRYPKIDANGDFFKDRDIAYGSNYNDQPEPVVVAGPHRAGFIDATAGYWEVAIDLSDSYVIADGASISSYGASVYPTSGVTESVNTGTGIGTIQFATAGAYWAAFTVTDDNGKSFTTYRLFLVHEDDTTSDDYPIVSFSAAQLTGSWGSAGWQGNLSFFDEISESEVPERALCIVWSRPIYGGTEGAITFLPDDNPTLLCGYATRGSIQADFEAGAGSYTLTIQTAQEIINQYNFSVSLEALSSGIDTWYEYANWLTVGRAIHHLFRWHSTLLQVCDVIGLTDNTDRRAFADIQDGTLYEMANGIAEDRGIRAKLVCDKSGRMFLTYDANLLTDSERNALTKIMDIEPDDWSGNINVSENQRPRAAIAKVSGFYWDGTYNASGDPDVEPYCAIAPGTVPEEFGREIVNLSRQVVRSQAHANELAGRVLAVANRKYESVSMSLAGNYSGILDVAFAEVYELDLQASDTPRGFSFGDQDLYCRNVALSLDVERGVVNCTASFEPEATGFDGIETDCLGFPTLPGLEDIPDDDALGGALVSASSVYFLPGQSKTWAQRSAEATSDLIQDPFWVTRQATVGSNSAILLRSGTGYIKRSTDGGQNWSDITPGSVDNDAGDSPAPAVANLDFKFLSPNFLIQGEFVALATWEESGGEERAWLYYTDDDGATWSHTSVAADGEGIGEITSASRVDSTSSETRWSFQDNGDIGVCIPAALSATKIIEVATGTPQRPGYIYYELDGSYNIDNFPSWSYLTAATQTESCGACDIVRITDTRALIVWEGGRPQACTMDWTGSSPSQNTAIDITTDSDAQRITAVRIGDLKCAVMFSVLDGATYRLKVSIIDISSGGALTVDTTTEIASGSDPYGNLCLGYLDSDYLAVGYSTGSNPVMYAALFDHATTPGLEDTVTVKSYAAGDHVYNRSDETGDPSRQIAVLSSTKFVVCYDTYNTTGATNGKPEAVVVTVSGTTLSAGTPADISAFAVYGGWEVFRAGDSGEYLIFTGINEISSGSVSGSTLTWDSDNEYSEAAVGVTGDVAAGCDMIDSTHLVRVGSTDAFNNIHDTSIYEFEVGTPESIYYVDGLGVDLDRVDGTTVWLTVLRQGDTLILWDYALPDLTKGDEVSLGGATEAQVANKTYWAFPYTAWDGNVYVFGRMNAPQSLSSPSHIIKSEDAGSSWSEVETSWGAGWCAAFFTSGNFLFAFRSTDSDTKLYRGLSALVLEGTLPFPEPINPHAIAYDNFEGTLYAAAGGSYPIMVAKTLPPYSVWNDITYSHPTGSAINALELL